MPFRRLLERILSTNICTSPDYALTEHRRRPPMLFPGQACLPVNDGHGRKDYIVLVDKLGEGSTSKVYLGHSVNDLRHNRVAVKICIEKDTREFLEEYKTMRSMIHPNILKVYRFHYACTTVSNYPYAILLLEYASNGNLRNYILERDEEPPSTEILHRWKKELIPAIEYLHGQKVVHGDLKPESILLDEYLRIKVSDFGSVGPIFGYRTDEIHRDVVPPELHNKVYRYCELPEGYDARALDAWCVGANLYFALTATFPFQETSSSKNHPIHQNKPLKSLLTEDQIHRGGPAYITLLVKLLDFNPRRRMSLLDVIHLQYYENVDGSINETEEVNREVFHES